MEFWYVEALKTLGNKADKLIYLKTDFNSKDRQRSCKKFGGNKYRGRLAEQIEKSRERGNLPISGPLKDAI